MRTGARSERTGLEEPRREKLKADFETLYSQSK
jgi:hypothetical protein